MFGSKKLNLTSLLSGNFIKISALQDILMHADLFANFLLDFAYDLACISPTKRKSLSICHRKPWLLNKMVPHKDLRTDNMHAKFCAGLGPIWLVAVKSNALQWSKKANNEEFMLPVRNLLWETILFSNHERKTQFLQTLI